MAKRMQPQHRAKSHWTTTTLLVFFYLVALSVAGVGNSTGLMNLLHWPLLVAVPVVFVFELFAVVLTKLADERRMLGENAWAPRILAGGVAAFVIILQWLGHQDGPAVFRYLYCGSSALAFAVYLIHSGNRRRDRQYEESGEWPSPDPRYGLWQWWTDRSLTLEARALFRSTWIADRKADGGRRRMTAEESLAMARTARRTRARHKALIELVTTDMAEAYGKPIADVIKTGVPTDEAAEYLLEQMDWRAQMAVYAKRADPARLDAALARAERNQRARDQADDRATGRPEPRDIPRSQSPRGSRQSARPSRATERSSTARDGWWTTARDGWYRAVYAARLDDRGEEAGGVELATGLGGLDPGNARNARDRHLRVRYADEYLRGERGPRDGTKLPDGVQRAITARSARNVTGELRQIGDRAP